MSKRFGRRPTAFVGVFLLGLGTTVVYPLFPPGSLVGPVVWGLVGGLLVGSVFLFDATVADVVDVDEARSGVHREGVFFGVWRMASKLARALGLAVTGWLLDAVGFAPGAVEQSDAATWGLALAFGPGVGVLFIAGALLWLCVPLDERVQARARAIIERRRSRRRRGVPLVD
jgi:GPH family glycoside/pentoside/hexuronide:cation symporter